MDNQGHSNPAADAIAKQRMRVMRAVVLVLPFVFGMLVHFSQVKGSVKQGFQGFVESLYFAVVTITTVGYGDYFPNTGTSKCLMILVSVVLANPSMCIINKIIGKLISWIVSKSRFYQRPVKYQIGSATFCMLILVVIIGPALIHLLEVKQMNYAEVYYFNVISLMTVGYGDFMFKSTGGQLFASFYLLSGPLLVLRYLDFVVGSLLQQWAGPNLEQQSRDARAARALDQALPHAVRIRNQPGVTQNVLSKVTEASESIVASQQQTQELLQALKRTQKAQERRRTAYNGHGRFTRDLVNEIQNKELIETHIEGRDPRMSSTGQEFSTCSAIVKGRFPWQVLAEAALQNLDSFACLSTTSR